MVSSHNLQLQRFQLQSTNMFRCLIKKVDEDAPEQILYPDVRSAYDRIKNIAESENLSVSDFTIIPVEEYEQL